MRIPFTIIAIALLMIGGAILESCGGDDGGGAQDTHETEQSSDAMKSQDSSNKAEKAKLSNVGPQIQIIMPSTGSTISGSSLQIQWTATDDSGAKPAAELSIRNVNSNDRTVIMASQPSIGSFTWTGFGSLSAGDYEIQLTASDGGLSNTAFSRIKKP